MSKVLSLKIFSKIRLWKSPRDRSRSYSCKKGLFALKKKKKLFFPFKFPLVHENTVALNVAEGGVLKNKPFFYFHCAVSPLGLPSWCLSIYDLNQ